MTCSNTSKLFGEREEGLIQTGVALLQCAGWHQLPSPQKKTGLWPQILEDPTSKLEDGLSVSPMIWVAFVLGHNGEPGLACAVLILGRSSDRGARLLWVPLATASCPLQWTDLHMYKAP